MQENMVLSKNSNMVTRVIQDETILLPIYKTSKEINCIYTLNKVGSRLWGLIDGKRTVGEIKKPLLKEFDATSQEIDTEMDKFLKELKEIKAIK